MEASIPACTARPSRQGKPDITPTYSRAEVQEIQPNSVKMQEFANAIHVSLLKMMHDQIVSSDTLPPELHLLIDGTNRKLTLFRQYLASMGLEQELWVWCNSQGLTRRGEDN